MTPILVPSPPGQDPQMTDPERLHHLVGALLPCRVPAQHARLSPRPCATCQALTASVHSMPCCHGVPAHAMPSPRPCTRCHALTASLHMPCSHRVPAQHAMLPPRPCTCHALTFEAESPKSEKTNGTFAYFWKIEAESIRTPLGTSELSSGILGRPRSPRPPLSNTCAHVSAGLTATLPMSILFCA